MRKVLNRIVASLIKIGSLLLPLLSIVTGICLVFLTYNQYIVSKTSQLPFFSVYEKKIYCDESIDDVSNITEVNYIKSKNLIISNSGQHARNVTVTISSFLMLSKTSGDDYYICIEINFYPLKEKINNTTGDLFIAKGVENVFLLRNLNFEIMNSFDNMMNAYDLKIVDYISISYFDMFNDRHEILFKGTEVIDKTPLLLFESKRRINRYPLDIHRISLEDIKHKISNGDYIKLPQKLGQ